MDIQKDTQKETPSRETLEYLKHVRTLIHNKEQELSLYKELLALLESDSSLTRLVPLVKHLGL